MPTVPPPSSADWSPPPPARSGCRWGWGLGLLLLLGCCFWSGLGTWFLGPLIPYTANHMTWVEGKLEVVVPAQQRPGGILSPDGRYLLVGRTMARGREKILWDLQNDTHMPVPIDYTAVCWLTSHELIALDSAAMTYYLVQAPGAAITPITVIQLQADHLQHNWARLQRQWQTAERVYALKGFLYGGTTVVTFEQGHPSVYLAVEGTEDLDRLIPDVSYIQVPQLCNQPPHPAPSPDGRWSAARAKGENGGMQIFDQEGTVVAQAFKAGWDPSLLGWAYDSSGVYFRTRISGSAASVLVPYSPIFKLSPLTPIEAIWQWTQRISFAVMVLVGLSDPVVQRRRHKRQGVTRPADAAPT